VETQAPASTEPEEMIKLWADTTITEEEKTMMAQTNEDHIVHEDAAAGVLCEEGEKERESPERSNVILTERQPLPNKTETAAARKLPPLAP